MISKKTEQRGETTIPEGRTEPNALILGTSNSILRRGWSAGYYDTFRGTVYNCSVGASSCASLLWQIADLAREAPDLRVNRIFLDSIVNDETFLTSSMLSSKQWAYYWSKILTMAPRENLSVLAFSSQAFFSEGSECSARIELACNALNISYCSLRRIFREALPAGLDPELLYLDEAHFERGVANAFGSWLGTKKTPENDVSINEVIERSGFSTLHPVSHDGHVKPVGTSMRQTQVFEFQQGMEFSLPGTLRLHGVCLDYFDSNCFLELTGDIAEPLSLDLRYKSDGSQFMGKFVHFPEPVDIGPRGLRAKVTATPAQKLVRCLHADKSADGRGVLGVVSFLCERPRNNDDPDAKKVSLALLESSVDLKQSLNTMERNSLEQSNVRNSVLSLDPPLTATENSRC